VINSGPVAGLALSNATAHRATQSCGAISSSYSCTWSGGGSGNSLTANVSFVDAYGNLAVESGSTNSTINLALTSAHGSVSPTSLTVNAGQSTTTNTFTLSMSSSNTAAVKITFGATYTLTVNLQT